MENREEKILTEIRGVITSIKAQLESLEDMVAALSSGDQTGTADPDTIELDIEDVMGFETETDVMEQVIYEEVENEAEDIGTQKPEPISDTPMEAPRPAMIDAMTAKEAWRTDMPGAPVKDIRSAISLNDRIIFINALFDEDPLLFQSVLTKINSMSGLDQVVEYLMGERPSWNMESDEVYRFMMAVRRRIQ